MNERDRNERDPGPGAGAPPVPRPSSLVAVDMQQKVINQCTLVIGGFADGLLTHVHGQTAPPGSTKERLGSARPGEATLSYLPLRLGEIRGFTTRLHLFGFGDDPRLAPSLRADYLPHAHGVIVTVPTLGEVSLAAAETGLPVALLGPEQQRAEWRARASVSPCFEGEATTAMAFPALKEISKAMLSALKKQR